MFHANRVAIHALVLAATFTAMTPAAAATFVYRGSLVDRGAPADGRYAFRLTFYDRQSGGQAIAPTTTLYDVEVSRGAFSADIAIDAAVHAHGTAWLDVAVGDASGAFVPLAERVAVRPDAVSAGTCWDTTGNTGTTPASNFVGNTDNVALEFRVKNARAMRLTPVVDGPFDTPSVIGGASVNGGANIPGATVGGGGSAIGICPGGPCANSVTNNYGVVSGGLGNAAAKYAVVAGGRRNSSTGDGSVVSGGEANVAAGGYATVGGGLENVAAGGESFASGYLSCAGADVSFAAGYRAKVRADSGSTACPGVTASPTTDIGTFVWADSTLADFVSSGRDQFLVRASGGVGINTNLVSAATVSIASTNPLLRVFNSTVDSVPGGRLLVSENGVSDAGGYMDYDASANVFTVGTNNGSTDSDTLVLPRGAGRVGIGRTPVANVLEVEGNASKTTATAWLANSDARIKRDIAPVENALDKLMQVRPVTFRYTDAYRAAHPSIVDTRYYNVVAQEFAQVFPDAVQRSGESVPGANRASDDDILQVDIHPALITTIAAAQELAAGADAVAARVATIERENAELRRENDRLRGRLDQLDRRIDALERR